MYRSAYLLVLLICTVSGALLDFQATGNDLLLECYVGGNLQAGTTFQFFTSLGGTPSSTLPPTDPTNNPTQLPYTVDSNSERFVRCVYEEDYSNFIAFGALPETTSYPPETIHVYRGSRASIMCPYVLGNLHEYLDPYNIFWDMRDGDVIQRISNTEATRLSSMNRTLRVQVTEPVDTATYRCSLEVSRCTKFNENNEVMERCAVEGQSPFGGPVVSLNILEPSQIAMLPERMEVCAGEVANFTCAAYGSFISISWMFDGETFMCSTSRCEHNATVIQHDIDATGNNHTGNVSITSTLFIETTGEKFANIVGEESYTVFCILRQDPGELMIQGEMNGVGMFSSELTVKEPKITPSASPITSTSTPTEDEVTSTLVASEQSGRIVAIAVPLAVVLAVLLVLCIVSIIAAVMVVRSRSRRRKDPVDSEPDSAGSTTRPSIRERVYEELPSYHIHGTENLYPPSVQQSLTCHQVNVTNSQQSFCRQNGVAYDPTNPKADNFSFHGSDYRGSDGHRSVVGSDVSGLSGVSGNEPGAHRMPTYSHDNSVVSSEQQLLLPPQPWEGKRFSDCSVSSRRTESTTIPATFHQEYFYRRSSTDIYPQHIHVPHCAGNISASMGNINYHGGGNPNAPSVFTEPHYPQLHSQPHNQPLPIRAPSQSPAHSSCSCASSASPYHGYAGSRHSASHSSQVSQPQVSDGVLLTVMNCLMHNKNCEILHCPCRQIQDRYKHLKASVVPLEQKTTPERSHRKSSIPGSSSSTDSSDSEPTTARRSNMRLNLNRLHPHFHMTTRSHVRKSSSSRVVESHRRSRSMSDLTPITETREIPTPQVGGAIKEGTPVCSDNRCLGDVVAPKAEPQHPSAQLHPTKEELLSPTTPLATLDKPCPLLLREISLSSDNLPTLCLNDCLLQLKTPSPLKAHRRLPKLKSSLKPVNESGTETDDSNTSTRSNSTSTENEAIKSSQSDHEETSLTSKFPMKRRESSGYDTQSEVNLPSKNISVRRGESSGYESQSDANSTLTDRPHTHGHEVRSKGRVSPAVSYRSCSPFETETTVSQDGTVVIKTTEC